MVRPSTCATVDVFVSDGLRAFEDMLKDTMFDSIPYMGHLSVLLGLAGQILRWADFLP